MSLDNSSIIELGALAIGLTGVFIFIRITYFDEKIPDQIKLVEDWLKKLEDDLEKYLASGQTKVADVLSKATFYSATLSKKTELESMEKECTNGVKFDMFTIGMIVFAIFSYLFALSDIILITTVVASVLWIFGIYTFHNLYSRYAHLKRLIRLRKQ